MDLPSEIVLAILSPLSRLDLKSARLVSKHWSLCAAKFLFDVIYISPSEEDIAVFEAITQHPFLSRFPRRLEYDGAQFMLDYSKEEYASDMWIHTYYNLDLSDTSAATQDRFDGPDPVINVWWNETVLPNKSIYQNMGSYGDCKVVDDGYRKYHEHAKYQLDCLRSGQFLEILIKGLQRLVSLTSVTLHSQWPFHENTLGRDTKSGSPLARSWNPVYPNPCEWSVFRYYANSQGWPDGAVHYLIITTALAQAQRHIRNFSLGWLPSLSDGGSPYVFDRSAPASTGLDIIAFQALEHFDLKLARYDNGHFLPNNVYGLALLVDSMDQLTSLSLSLSSTLCTTHEKVFLSATKVWSKLKTFKLENMSTTATDLLLLLVFHMPEMRHLELGGIILLRGTWHSVIEGLKQSNRLSYFGILDGRGLLHSGDSIFMLSISRFHKSVRNYILHGGHHPCIAPNEPDCGAQKYMRAIDPSVRARLGEMDCTRSEELDSVARQASMDSIPEEERGNDEFDGSQASWEMLTAKERRRKGHKSNFEHVDASLVD